MPGGLPERHRMEGNTKSWLGCVYWCPPIFQGGCHCSLELHKSRPARCGSPARLSLDPLTHSSPRPDEREERTGGEDWKKKRAMGGSLLLVGELLAFFRAVAFSQAHIIQSNLPSVATPFFTSEDDLGRERTPVKSPLPLPNARSLHKIKANVPPNSKLYSTEGETRTWAGSPEACLSVETEILSKLLIRPHITL